MGYDNQPPPDAWALSALGTAIGAYVDREINKPTAIANSGAYGIDERGNLYTLGQPAGQVVSNVSTTGRGVLSPTVLLLILGGLYLASK